jgi:hypothetical protein
MGKTVLPFSQVLAAKQQEYAKFRRALRQEDQHAFDALFELAKLNIQAAVYYASPEAAEAFFMSVLIENFKSIGGLEQRIEQLEEKLKKLESGNNETAA